MKSEINFYQNNKISIIGSKSAIITNLLLEIIKKHRKKYKIGVLNNIDKLDFDAKMEQSQLDFLFINSNNKIATQQILFLDDNYDDDFYENLAKFTQIQFVIKANKETKYPKFLITKFPTIKNLKRYLVYDIDEISKHIENLIQANIASVNSLILIGGKSIRMGSDKSKLNYHGKPQATYLFDLLSKSIISTHIFYSVRDEKQLENEQIIVDKTKGLGPFGGIYAAFLSNPNTAWFTIATDLPFITENLIKMIFNKRNPSKIATTFQGENKKFPEPLITIWEPKSFPILQYHFFKKQYSLTQLLQKNDVEIIKIKDELIQNINTKEAFNTAKINLDIEKINNTLNIK